MRRIAAGLMLILLTACSGSDPTSAASASVPVEAVAQPAPVITPAVEVDIVVPISPGDNMVSNSEKLAAKTLAEDLLRVLLNLEVVVDDSNIMNDATRYGRYFSSVLEAPLLRWQRMNETSKSDVFGDLGYCRQAGRALSSLGEMVYRKGFSQQFLDERRAQYAEALPKCQQAIKARS